MSDVLKRIQNILLRCGKLELFFNGKDGGRCNAAWLVYQTQIRMEGCKKNRVSGRKVMEWTNYVTERLK